MWPLPIESDESERITTRFTEAATGEGILEIQCFVPQHQRQVSKMKDALEDGHNGGNLESPPLRHSRNLQNILKSSVVISTIILNHNK